MSKFLKKNSNEKQVSSNFQKKPLEYKIGPRIYKMRLKIEKQKESRKGVQTLVKLSISEKSWNFKKKFRRWKKIVNFWKLLQKSKKRKIEKRANEIENKHQKVEEKPENIYRKFRKKLGRPKNGKFGKIGKT